MAVASHYSQMIMLKMGGERHCRTIEMAANFLHQCFGDGLAQLNNGDVQRALWQRKQATSQRESALADLCLRCFISYQIDQTCGQITAQFGHHHGFKQTDLLRFVLSDDGRIDQGRGLSFAATILNTFDIDRAGLGHWVAQRVKQQPELNQFLLEQGVYRVSDWAILNDTSVAQVRRILSEFHTLSQIEIETNARLLGAYHQIYRGDRLKHKSRQGRLCPSPSTAQLQRMVEWLSAKRPSGISKGADSLDSPPHVMTALAQLASYLRQYRIYVRGGQGGQGTTVSLDAPEGQGVMADRAVAERPEDDDADTFLAQYRQQFLVCLDQAIAEVIGDRITQLKRRKKGNAKGFSDGLHLFHCRGLSMGAIAKALGLQAQYQVSRLLKLKDVRADVRRAVLARLGASIQALALPYVDAAHLQKVDAQIENALAEQVDAMFQAAEAETSSARDRPLKNVFARRLCQYLNALTVP